MDLLSQHIGGVGGLGSRSLVEALTKQIYVFEAPLFDNAAAYGCAVGVLIGTWFASYILSDGLWYLWTLNWKRLLCCFVPGGRTGKQPEDPFFRSPHDPNESANKPQLVPLKFQVGGTASKRTTTKVGDAVGVQPQPYATVAVEPSLASGTLWSGVKRTRTENYVRLTVLIIRLLVLVAGVMLAFQAAGVNVLSLAASMGILSLCFSYGGASLLRNFLNIMYLHGTDKLAMGVYCSLDPATKGVITAFRTQWIELTDDLNPLKGRQIHQIPSAAFMEGKVTVFPDGPPLEDVMLYFDLLERANAFRAKHNLGPLRQLDTQVWLHSE
jgi:hypothetical protein